ncbi:NADH-quinone oxidoreductase subunit C [candidate division KSB1 bacterium]|nr:NADH-quinone oxidoreductase subunit C [candidate division KSB1 bacterium]
MQQYWLLKDDLPDIFQQFPAISYNEEFGQGTFRIAATDLGKIFDFLKTHKSYPMDMLTDITAVDYLSGDYAERPNLTGREEDLYSESRYDLVYHFYSVSKNKRIRIIASCGGENPAVISSYKWWQAAHFLEREVWDMFGIKFENHPDLRRVLLYEEFEGHPLRKDYPTMGEQPRIPLRNPEHDNA